MGVVIVVAFAVYLLISLSVVAWARSHAKKNGQSAKRWGWGAAFVMYSLVFWDWIPTVAVHQFYCAKDSGFWVYKTLEQWKVENPGVMEGLVANKGEHDVHEGDMTNFTATHIWNQRFNLIFNKSGPFLVNNWRHEQIVLDSKTNEEMARFIDFSTGNGKVGGEPELRFWMHSDGCIGSNSQAKVFVKFAKQFRGAEK